MGVAGDYSWALLGLVTACLTSTMMLMQERFKVDGYALPFWIKISCIIVTLPFVVLFGIPADPLFYVYLGLTALLYAISDVVFFTAIPKTSAGAVARLVPTASVFSFIIWFAIDPALLTKYMAAPVISALIFMTLCLFAYFAFRLKKCTVTMETIRCVWFVILAATIGPLLTKLTTYHADMKQAIYAYVFFQALMMVILWYIFLLVRRPIPMSVFFAPATIRPGLLIGLVAAAMVLMKFTIFYYVDNPAYIPAIVALDSVIIIAYYKLRGIRHEGDIISGLGIVACAVLLIVLKAQV